MMKINDLPLLNLFERLRQAGLVLGLDEYQLLLKSLMAGFGLADEQALARLCKTLWVKSPEERQIFDYYFSQIMSQPIVGETVTLEQSTPTKSEEIHSPSPPPKPIISPSSDKPPSPSSLPQPDEQPIIPSSPVISSETDDVPDMIPEMVLEIKDEVQIAKNQAIQHIDVDTNHHFLLFSDYLPVTAREMKQTWRYLRRPVREGIPVELDLEATVKQINQEGFFINPVLVPRRVNRVELILLLDVDGSMVAFHSLGDRIQETAIRGGRLGRSQVYYFHNCPVDYLYSNPALLEASTFDQVLNLLSPAHACVLIFSDAGAARGGYSENRIELTEKFLRKFQQKLRYIAWLNPVPQERWQKTTAEEIAKLVPMFDCDRRGLQNAVQVLRGNLSMT